MVEAVADIKCRCEVVIVKPIEETEIGGILLPQQSQESGQKGFVCATGPGTKEIVMEVEKEDKILYCKYAGSEVKIDGTKFIIMKQEDILGVYYGDNEIDLLPLETRILVRWENADEHKGTTILRAKDATKEQYFTGVVMGIGPGVTDEDLSVGKRIFFNQFCGPERIDFEGKRYAMVHEHDAYLVIPVDKDIVVMSH